MKLSNNKGVTLIALSITIIVILIITSILIYNSKNQLVIKKLNNLYNDIDSIDAKVSEYYLKYGELPIFDDKIYINKESLKLLLKNNGATKEEDKLLNVNDDDNYYVINLSKLDNLTINYGEDYTKWKEDSNSDYTSSQNVYIINKVSQQIYYPMGIKIEDDLYYARNIENNTISPIEPEKVGENIKLLEATDERNVDLFDEEDIITREDETKSNIKINIRVFTSILTAYDYKIENLQYAWTNEESIENNNNIIFTNFDIKEDNTAIIESRDLEKGDYYLYIKIIDNYGNEYLKRTNKLTLN